MVAVYEVAVRRPSGGGGKGWMAVASGGGQRDCGSGVRPGGTGGRWSDENGRIAEDIAAKTTVVMLTA